MTHMYAKNGHNQLKQLLQKVGHSKFGTAQYKLFGHNISFSGTLSVFTGSHVMFPLPIREQKFGMKRKIIFINTFDVVMLSQNTDYGYLWPSYYQSFCDCITGMCIVVISRHYDNTPMQYTAIFHPCKNGRFKLKNCDIFLIFAQNIDC